MSWATYNKASNNIHPNFPAMMNDGNIYTDWDSSCTMNNNLNSDYVLYRGSNAILFALNLNKTIIYYNKPNEFYLNPLHEKKDKIKSISNIFDLNKISLDKKNENYEFKDDYIEDLKYYSLYHL